jgi:XRE family transcriptional regulator of biofilm formation
MIGQRIQQIRIERGLTLSELAEKASIAKSYLSNVERGIQTNPSIQVIEKIASALDISMDTLLITTTNNEQLIADWQLLILEAMALGVDKGQFRELLAYYKWKAIHQQNE